MNKAQLIAALTANGIAFNANDTIPVLRQLHEDNIGPVTGGPAPAPSAPANPLTEILAAVGPLQSAKSGIGMGIVDIPNANYELQSFEGVTKSGMRKVKYKNTATGAGIIFYGIDSFPELWEADKSALKTNLTFGFDAEKKKVSLATL